MARGIAVLISIFRDCICFLLHVTFDTDYLSADRLHVHCHVILFGLIFKLRLSGGLPIHLCGKREDVVVELIFFSWTYFSFAK